MTYSHHEKEVVVREDLKGKHREFCQCYECDNFNPENREENCPIANDLFDVVVKHNLVTPVWECPESTLADGNDDDDVVIGGIPSK